MAHVRRGAKSGRTKAPSRAPAVPKKIAAKLPMKPSEANALARWMFGLFVLAIAIVAVIALDLPAQAGKAAGEAVGDAGFRVRSVDVQGLKRMNPKPVYAIALDQKTNALPLVDVAAIRERLLAFGWVKDARVSRRYPDTLVVDIVERSPAALWQDADRLNLIDSQGIVLDRVPVSQMPDLPLLIGAGANAHAKDLNAMLARAPAIRDQLVSASWVGQRRWDLALQTGEVIALPEGAQTASDTLVKFAKMDKAQSLIGRGVKRYDLRIPNQMIVRLPGVPAPTPTPTPEG